MPIARVENGAVAEVRHDLNIGDVPPHKAHAWKPIVFEGAGSNEQRVVDGDTVKVIRSPTSEDVDAERDHRLQTFMYDGKLFDYDPVSRGRIETARNSAGWAMVAGKQPGDLRWADPNVDFGWIAADNSFVTMDAPTTLAFGNAAAAWEGLHIVKARLLKDMNPIPGDFQNDTYWP